MVALSTGTAVHDFVLSLHNQRENQVVWLNVNTIPLFQDNSKKPYQVFVALENISTQKRLNDIRNARQKLLEFSVTHSLDELLVETLDELETLTNSTIGFYHFYSEKQKNISLQAWSSRNSSKFCHVEGLQAHF